METFNLKHTSVVTYVVTGGVLLVYQRGTTSPCAKARVANAKRVKAVFMIEFRVAERELFDELSDGATRVLSNRNERVTYCKRGWGVFDLKKAGLQEEKQHQTGRATWPSFNRPDEGNKPSLFFCLCIHFMRGHLS
jgi:hypothetical protein